MKKLNRTFILKILVISSLVAFIILAISHYDSAINFLDWPTQQHLKPKSSRFWYRFWHWDIYDYGLNYPLPDKDDPEVIEAMQRNSFRFGIICECIGLCFICYWLGGGSGR